MEKYAFTIEWKTAVLTIIWRYNKMQKQKIISRKQAIAEARKFYKITDCEHSREDEKSYIQGFLQALEDDGYTIKAD